MVNKLEYEFKQFASGKRKGAVYCNIRSAKTGKTIKTVSSKSGLQKAHKSKQQQIRRQKKQESWGRVEQAVQKQGGTRKQYEKGIKRLKAKGIKGKKAERKAIFQTGVSTYVRFFYQSSAKDVKPYTIGESDPEHDDNIEYDTYQHKFNGNELVNQKEWFDQVFNQTVQEIKDADQVLHYGGYEIIVKDNETGKTIDYACRGGKDPLKAGLITKTTRTRKTKDTRF